MSDLLATFTHYWSCAWPRSCWSQRSRWSSRCSRTIGSDRQELPQGLAHQSLSVVLSWHPLCLFQYPLSLTFFWYALCKFSDCAQSCQSHQLPMWKQPFVLCSDYRICLLLSSKPFILQTHIGVCCQLPLRAGQWPLWTRNIQESVINIPVTCANLWLFHLLRGAVSFLPRNLIQLWFSK